MMNNTFPMTRDLVLLGGGHTHALVLRKWGMNPLAGVRLTVINPGPTAPYSGMLPGFVAGHYSRDELDIDLVQLARFAGARVILGAASAVDLTARTVNVIGRPASIDVGITSTMPDLKGFTEHGVPAKPLGTFASRWDAVRNDGTAKDIAVIGGGVAGAELAMAMSFAMGGKAEVKLIDRGVVLKDGPTRPCDVRQIPPPDVWDRDPPVRFRKTVPTSWLELTISEGRNRQVRRMTAAVGLPTLRLVRVRVGPYSLDGLDVGQWRQA